MTARIRLDDLTDDQLDQLYTRLETAEAAVHEVAKLAGRWTFTPDRKAAAEELRAALAGGTATTPPPPAPANGQEGKPPMTNPDRPCPHENFTANVAVNRLTASDTDPTVVGYYADIRVSCADCEEPFRWTGLQAGLSPARPMCSVNETVMHAPLRPASADPDFGMGLPGYAVTWREGPAAEQPADTPKEG